ncbi:hypothetical protein ABKN59_006360 [Abortiporus biennis]
MNRPLGCGPEFASDLLQLSSFSKNPEGPEQRTNKTMLYISISSKDWHETVLVGPGMKLKRAKEYEPNFSHKKKPPLPNVEAEKTDMTYYSILTTRSRYRNLVSETAKKLGTLGSGWKGKQLGEWNVRLRSIIWVGIGRERRILFFLQWWWSCQFSKVTAWSLRSATGIFMIYPNIKNHIRILSWNDTSYSGLKNEDIQHHARAHADPSPTVMEQALFCRIDMTRRKSLKLVSANILQILYLPIPDLKPSKRRFFSDLAPTSSGSEYCPIVVVPPRTDVSQVFRILHMIFGHTVVFSHPLATKVPANQPLSGQCHHTLYRGLENPDSEFVDDVSYMTIIDVGNNRYRRCSTWIILVSALPPSFHILTSFIFCLKIIPPEQSSQSSTISVYGSKSESLITSTSKASLNNGYKRFNVQRSRVLTYHMHKQSFNFQISPTSR